MAGSEKRLRFASTLRDPDKTGPSGSRKLEGKPIVAVYEELGNEMPLALEVLLWLGKDELRQTYQPEA